MNSYLGPLVEDLNVGWNDGFVVKTHGDSEISLRICIACDIPASRKVCGFLGHNALGCNKCFNNVSLGHTDYSGFDRENWERRSCSAHRESCMTKTGMRKAESKFGVRYSLLLNLPYFDPLPTLIHYGSRRNA